MATQAPVMTGFEKWQDGLSQAVNDARWDAHDCDVQAAVAEFNQHLNGVGGYSLLDWQVVKAMLWVESGAAHPEWKSKPMQIGVAGDPGLTAFLAATEGGNLILPKTWHGRLTVASARTVPSHNIRAGIGYLLMRMARFEHRSVPGADAAIREVLVKPGDSLEKIARLQGSTPEVLKRLNPAATILKPGQTLKIQKASVEQVIVGWRMATTAMIAQRYNGGGDPNYARKLDFALRLVRERKGATCAR